MGQKASLITIKPFRKTLNLCINNSKIFTNLLQFCTFFAFLLKKGGIWILNNTVNAASNRFYLTLNLFYRMLAINKMQKGLRISKPGKDTFFTLYSHTFLKLFKTYINILSSNLFLLTVKVSNIFINKVLVKFLYKKTRRFVSVIFVRRYKLYLDFLNMTSLFLQNLLSVTSYLSVISLIFTHLHKRTHVRFFFFLTELFKVFTEIVPAAFPALDRKILGLKMVVCGKIRGKLRASSKLIQEGVIPVQSISGNVDYACVHSYTLLGVFGFKMWVYRKNTTNYVFASKKSKV